MDGSVPEKANPLVDGLVGKPPKADFNGRGIGLLGEKLVQVAFNRTGQYLIRSQESEHRAPQR